MSEWTTYLVQYGVGGVVFVLGVLLGIRGTVDPVLRAHNRRVVPFISSGVLVYAVGHAWWLWRTGRP